MGDKSKIEWTDATWNPTVGCSIVSPGCTNCYAMKVANGLERRFDSPKYRGLTKVVNGNPVWTGEVRLDEAALLEPLKWRRGRRIFVNSMSDLFHESLSDADIDRVFAVMALCPQHTFQVLTKRAERMRKYLTRHDVGGRWGMEVRGRMVSVAPETALSWTRNGLPNVWLGVSCERQQEADERIPLLLQTPAAVRFISAEPLLGPLDLRKYFDGLDWAIVGGESGKNARPMHPDWARSLRNQCARAGVPYFFKQWGEYSSIPIRGIGDAPLTAEMYDGPIIDGTGFVRLGKKLSGRILDGSEHNDFPNTLPMNTSGDSQAGNAGIVQ